MTKLVTNTDRVLTGTALAALAAPLLAACLSGPARAEQGSLGEPKMLVYGNYCGPGNNAPLPPIDALDAACARHDACTPDGTLSSPACDLRLKREAERIERDPRAREDERAMAGVIAAGATVLSLLPPDVRTPGVPAPDVRAPDLRAPDMLPVGAAYRR